MTLISWNVNGLRACLKKGFIDFIKQVDADVFCVQETKATKEQTEADPNGQLFTDALQSLNFADYWNNAVKKGYSGTAVFTRIAPLSVSYGFGIAGHDGEGRVITMEYEEFYLVTVYTPNSQRGLTRLDYRMAWEDAFREHVSKLDAVKPVIICGDMNVAHTAIDLKNAKSNEGNAGYTIQEREKMTLLLEAGFVDFYRQLYPNKHDAYTWWSYMGRAREKNIGWRIDYFIGSKRLTEKVNDALIYPEVYGSDHCPIGLILKYYSGN